MDHEKIKRATAITKFGRAVELAAETGNDEAAAKLRKVVDVENEAEGTDHCDVCGIAMDAATDGTAAPSPEDTATFAKLDPATEGGSDGTCPNCQASNPVDALFCEACGYDFTTGSLPRPMTMPGAPPTLEDVTPAADPNPSPTLSTGWVAEVWVDPDWYSDQSSADPLPSPGIPLVVPLKHTSILIGRASRSRGITPDIDLSSDNGISRRHAQLTTDGTRWWVEDLGSSNGTYVGGSVGRLPVAPILQGQKKEIASDDRVYLGAWTRIVIRKAAEGEF